MATYDELHDHVHGLVLDVAPDAAEGTSSGMPAWQWKGRPPLGLNAAKAHGGVDPFRPEAVEAVHDRLDGFTLTEGGVQCTPDSPAPDDVIVEMVRLRMAEID